MKSYCLFLFAILFQLTASAQVFRLYELDRYTQNPDLPPVANGSYVDINATLQVTLDKAAIAAAIRDFTGDDTSMSSQLQQLRAVLANQVEILDGFQAYAADPSLNSLNNLAEQMNAFFMAGDKYPEIQNLYNEFSERYNQTYSRLQRRQAGQNGIPFRDEFIFVAMAERAEELAGQIQQGLSEGKVNFLLSGRLMTRSGEREVKLSDDFDDFAAEIYTVPRWQMQMTENNLQDLQEIAMLGNRLNWLMDAKGDDIKNWLRESFQADDCLRSVVDRLESIPRVVEEMAPEVAGQLREVVTGPIRQGRNLMEAYSGQQASAETITSVELLSSFSGSLRATATAIEGLLNTMDQDVLAVLTEVPEDDRIQAFRLTYDSCRVQLQRDKEQLLNVAGRLLALFSSSGGAAKAAAGLSDKVRRLSFDAIPEESFIDLRNTGPRDNGDQLKIRAILESPGEDGEPPLRRIIDQRLFKVQQIGLYSLLKPMLLLANPVGSGANVDLSGKQFQFGPSYSMLFKFGSRKSRAINEIWQPGFGVNFGTLDFNTDATPEFTAGLEFTFLKDYFSGGYGYNFGADEGYYFIGFRLPVGAIPLPVLNEVQN